MNGGLALVDITPIEFNLMFFLLRATEFPTLPPPPPAAPPELVWVVPSSPFTS